MAKAILLVDEKREVVLLLHSALDTLGIQDLEVTEAASGADAVKQATSKPIDLLVSNSRLPDMAGIELMRAVGSARPGVNHILITSRNDRSEREELLQAGAVAVFNKPVPLGDFLDSVERGLDLATAAPATEEASRPGDRPNLAELLGSLVVETKADTTLILNARGQVVGQSGELRDRTMEVSLMASLTASFLANLNVTKTNRQDTPDNFSVFAGGDHDLVLVAVDDAHALVLAARHPGNLAEPSGAIQAALAARPELSASIPLAVAEGQRRNRRAAAGEETAGASGTPAGDLEQLLAAADNRGVSGEALDDFWDEAATRHADRPLSEDVITYDEARRRGLAPDRED
jgi:CheY-like chemotaxis protein